MWEKLSGSKGYQSWKKKQKYTKKKKKQKHSPQKKKDGQNLLELSDLFGTTNLKNCVESNQLKEMKRKKQQQREKN